MTDADRQAFAGRMKRAVDAAAARGQHAYGYHVREGEIILLTRPAERRRGKVGRTPDQAGVHPTSRRGISQGQLL